ncbi:MAG: TetR/AcrR family transcriptional regulator [Aeromicrobium sp.]|uniref:TetR/AcrR family transcriptional regulator n=1 Tax=Aeromicrobium sp. TaxID=1871063 RepID=UPI003C38C9D6
MVRLTRSEVQDRNRRVLLDVARAAFLRDGYVATSVASIAHAAGFTTGIVYSGFGSKADLAMQVATELQEEQIALLGDHLTASERHLLVRQARTWARSAAESGWIRFELELLLDSIGDSRLAAAQVTRQQHAVAQIAHIIGRLVPPGMLTDDAIEVIAETTVDYSIGVGIRQTTNPAATPERFVAMIEPMLVSVFEDPDATA